MSSAGGRPSRQKMVSVGTSIVPPRAPPVTRRHAGPINRRYDTAGHSLNSRLCRFPVVDPLRETTF